MLSGTHTSASKIIPFSVAKYVPGVVGDSSGNATMKFVTYVLPDSSQIFGGAVSSHLLPVKRRNVNKDFTNLRRVLFLIKTKI